MLFILCKWYSNLRRREEKQISLLCIWHWSMIEDQHGFWACFCTWPHSTRCCWLFNYRKSRQESDSAHHGTPDKAAIRKHCYWILTWTGWVTDWSETVLCEGVNWLWNSQQQHFWHNRLSISCHGSNCQYGDAEDVTYLSLWPWISARFRQPDGEKGRGSLQDRQAQVYLNMGLAKQREDLNHHPVPPLKNRHHPPWLHHLPTTIHLLPNNFPHPREEC